MVNKRARRQPLVNLAASEWLASDNRVRWPWTTFPRLRRGGHLVVDHLEFSGSTSELAAIAAAVDEMDPLTRQSFVIWCMSREGESMRAPATRNFHSLRAAQAQALTAMAAELAKLDESLGTPHLTDIVTEYAQPVLYPYVRVVEPADRLPMGYGTISQVVQGFMELEIWNGACPQTDGCIPPSRLHRGVAHIGDILWELYSAPLPPTWSCGFCSVVWYYIAVAVCLFEIKKLGERP